MKVPTPKWLSLGATLSTPKFINYFLAGITGHRMVV
jgi:hypothetical protein